MDAFTEKVLMVLVGAVLSLMTLWVARGNRAADVRKKDAETEKTVSETMQNVLVSMSEQAEQTKELRVEVDALHHQGAVKDGKITELEKEVGELRAEIGDLREQVTTKDSHIVARDRKIADQATKIAGLERRVSEVEAEATELRSEVVSLRAENADLKAHFESGKPYPQPN